MEYGFSHSPHDCSTFILSLVGHVLIFFIYVDDIVLIGDSIAQSLHFIDTLSTKFDIKDLHILYCFWL